MHTLGFILRLVGELLIAYSILIVHDLVSVEKKIDRHVTRAMCKEKKIVLAGIALMICGALLEITFNL